MVGLDNLYFDTSAVCEPMATATVLRIMGHQRVLYGSDSIGQRSVLTWYMVLLPRTPDTAERSSESKVASQQTSRKRSRSRLQFS